MHYGFTISKIFQACRPHKWQGSPAFSPTPLSYEIYTMFPHMMMRIGGHGNRLRTCLLVGFSIRSVVAWVLLNVIMCSINVSTCLWSITHFRITVMIWMLDCYLHTVWKVKAQGTGHSCLSIYMLHCQQHWIEFCQIQCWDVHQTF